ncbi:telomere binding protein [Pseudocyphellaria aurata]|nr:telomere binding protein [Pseudocyphellaria aurata]
MDALLSPLKTTIISETDQPGSDLVAVGAERRSTSIRQISVVQSPEDALEALKSKPDSDLLTKALRWLDRSAANIDGFNIKIPGPKAAQIIFVLVVEIVPDYWRSLNGKVTSIQFKQKKSLFRCLCNVAGIGAITARLRVFLDLKDDPQINGQSSISVKSQGLEILLDVLETLLDGSAFVSRIWIDMNSYITNASQRALLWKEFIAIVAGGRLLSHAAEAFHFINKSTSDASEGRWLGNGSQYCSWLGENIAHILMSSQKERAEDWKALALLVNRALKLGYTDQLVEATCSSFILGEDHLLTNSVNLVQNLGVHEQRSFLHSLLRILSKRHLENTSGGHPYEKQQDNKKALGGTAALISKLVQDSEVLQDGLVDWLTGVSGDAVGQDFNVRRAVVAALAHDQARILHVLNKSLELFGDKLSIRHTPMLHQEVNTQVLLMVAGIIHRNDAQKLSTMARSSLYLSAISNRLAASSTRASLLGMIVGTAISELVDSREKRMNFSTEEVNSTEGQWYRSLTQLTDPVGTISDLKPSASSSSGVSSSSSRNWSKSDETSKISTKTGSTSKIISIEELDNSESEDEDLVRYEKPDSDPSDSEEDATLVQRNRPVAPVYIRDLIAGLRDTENFDRYKLAIVTAPSLIRRKSKFGTEVTEHIEELASLLVGLNDKYEMDKFQEMRLQGMIAVLIAQPLQMGQWFARTYFSGDYSIGQRASILSTLGLGARELAGFQQEDAALTGGDVVPEKSFPSKKLPEKLHKVFLPEESSSSPLNSISQSLENIMLQPMALSAADKLSGPNVLKVRTFSSRMAVEKKRQKPIPNALAKIVADGFFLPLTGRWRIHLQAYGTRTPHTSAPLLPLFLKTLAVLVHASGPSTLSLPQLTTEFWSLLLALRPSAAEDVTVLEAILFGCLTILDVNDSTQRRLADENAKELLETRAWAEAVWERGAGGEGRARVLCAAVLSRVADVVGAWERTMAGELSGWL